MLPVLPRSRRRGRLEALGNVDRGLLSDSRDHHAQSYYRKGPRRRSARSRRHPSESRTATGLGIRWQVANSNPLTYTTHDTLTSSNDRELRWSGVEMRRTNIPCPACGESFVDVAGLGERNPALLCNNRACPSHYRHVKCPDCGEAVARVRVLGLGHQHFTCAEGHVWSSIPGQ